MFVRASIYASLGLLSHCVTSSYGWQCHDCGPGDALSFRFGLYRSGDGALANRHGYIYRGKIRDNLPNGRGKLTLPDGFRIEGIWNKGSPNDPATIVFPDGSQHSGTRELWGRIYGVCIHGSCTDDYGVLIASSATTFYVGEFSNKKLTGAGVLIERSWVHESFSTAMIHIGRFLDGELKSGTIFCVRSYRQCQRLLVRRHETPEIRVDWVDRIDFFDGPERPTIADLESVARELLERESPE